MKKRKESLSKFFGSSKWVRWGILVIVMSMFTIILYPNLITSGQHSYQVGDVAERDIKAHRDFSIINKEATKTAREQVAEKILTVYDHDETLLPKLIRQVNQAFGNMRKIFETEKQGVRDTGVIKEKNKKPATKKRLNLPNLRHSSKKYPCMTKFSK